MDAQQIWITSMHKNNCRVCGLYAIEPPWGSDGETPSWEICLCCGTEFGYEDCTIDSVKKQREKWISSGCNWIDIEVMPFDWSFEEQAKQIPDPFK